MSSSYHCSIFFTLILLNLCQSSTSDNPKALKYYGENCTSLEDCDAKESLACINQTCQCQDPLHMTFDPSRSLCVGRAGHPCVWHPSEAPVSPGKRNPCVQHASCDTTTAGDEGSGNGFGSPMSKNTTCQCWSSFYSDSQGNCVRKKEYFQKCDNPDHCNGRKGLICNKDLGICTCDLKVSSYNADTERCVGLPNHECVNVYRECSDNHKCKAGVCRCKFKEVETTNGTILCDPVRHKYNKVCGRFRGDCGDEVMTNLRCLDGKCRCRNPDYQTYDYDRRICVSKVGGPCNINQKEDLFRNGTANSKFNPSNFPVIQCISYAECIPHKIPGVNATSDNTTTRGIGGPAGVCECGESFIETKKGLCSLPFGADCDTSPKNKKDQCAEPLKCVSNRCGCQNDVDVYEGEGRKCAKSVKSLCWKDSSCVKNAECRKRTKSLPGRCKCRAKFRATSSGTCL